ncbi:MAG TPA: ABC transporter permease [Caproiciproducens sp.]|nr:ABC transporter permease [Caproiciproducens sp.]
MISDVFSDVGLLSTIQVTLILAISSTTVSSILGIPFGLFLEQSNFPGKRIVIRINRTLLGIPPVAVGLIVYLLLMNRGPLGPLSLLFTIRGMIIAQTIIITPIISSMVYSYAVRTAPAIRMFAVTMGANKGQAKILLLKEMKNEIYLSIVTGFGRSISEVGAVMLVGGNIKGRTRTMTTAISMLKSQGIFTEGITLGIVLLIFAFLLQWVAESFQKRETEDENY